jgi:uncharacterized membrane protein (UPF0127 family)
MLKGFKIKIWHWVLLIAIVLTAGVLQLWQYHWTEMKIVLKGQELRVLVADTLYHQYRGLGNRDNLGDYQGMIFPYPYADRYAVVMRAMRFPIDIVWINNGVAVDIAPNLPVEPQATENTLTRYYPRLPANLILELPAGWVEKNGLEIGDRVSYSTP